MSWGVPVWEGRAIENVVHVKGFLLKLKALYPSSSGPQSVSAMVWREAKENLFEFCADLK